jgi:hypothetical protein
VQLWHGDADSIISYTNQTEAIKQWTNVLGVAATPTSTTMVAIGSKQYEREQWQDGCGSVVLDAWSENQGPHGTDANLNAQYAIPFLALDDNAAVDPQVSKCLPASGGGGAGGAGGAVSSAGTETGGNADGGAGSGAGGTPSAGNPAMSTGGSSGAAIDSSSAGTSANASGSSGSANSDAPSATVPSRPGMSCGLAGRPGPSGGAFASAILALTVLLDGRRRARRAGAAR